MIETITEKNIIKIVTILTILYVYFGCSKQNNYIKKYVNDVEVTVNKNKQSDLNFKVDLKEVLVIDLLKSNKDNSQDFINLTSADRDRFGNTYVLDGKKSKIHKFNEYGNHVLSFGSLGQGPGEFVSAWTFSVWKDTVFVPYYDALKIIKYDLHGKYISEKKLKNIADFPNGFMKSSDFMWGLSFTPNPKKGNGHYIKHTNVYDEQFAVLNKFHELNVDYTTNLVDLNYPINLCLAISKDSLIYVPKYSTNEYIIDVYDLTKVKRKIIKKKYFEIPYTQEELKEIEEVYTQTTRSKVKCAKNKFSIDLIWIDKQNRLWVKTNTTGLKNVQKFDVFENGVYLNYVIFPIDMSYSINFIGDYIIAFSPIDNKVVLYDY